MGQRLHLLLLAAVLGATFAKDDADIILHVKRAQAWNRASEDDVLLKDSQPSNHKHQRKQTSRHYWGMRSRKHMTDAQALIDVGNDAPPNTDEIPETAFCHSTPVHLKELSSDKFIRFCYYTATTPSVSNPGDYDLITPQVFAEFADIDSDVAEKSEGFAVTAVVEEEAPTSNKAEAKKVEPEGKTVIKGETKLMNGETPSLTPEQFATELKHFAPPSKEQMKAMHLEETAVKQDSKPAASETSAAASLDNPLDYIQNPQRIMDSGSANPETSHELELKVQQLEQKLKIIEGELSARSTNAPPTQQRQESLSAERAPTPAVDQPSPVAGDSIAEPAPDVVPASAPSTLVTVSGSVPPTSDAPSVSAPSTSTAVRSVPSTNADVVPVTLSKSENKETNLASSGVISTPDVKLTSSGPSEENTIRVTTAPAVNGDVMNSAPATSGTSVGKAMIDRPTNQAFAVTPQEPPEEEKGAGTAGEEKETGMPLVDSFDFFEPGMRKRIHHKVPAAPELKELLWNVGNNDKVTHKEMLEEQALLALTPPPPPHKLSVKEARTMIDTFMTVTNMLQLSSPTVHLPLVSGSRKGVYHTPESFGWVNSNQAQGFALDMPQSFTSVTIMGDFSAQPPKGIEATKDLITMEWAILIKNADNVSVVNSGTFDVTDGKISMAREAQFYRRVTTNKVPLGVGTKPIEISQSPESQLMLWMRPQTPCSIEIADNLDFAFSNKALVVQL